MDLSQFPERSRFVDAVQRSRVRTRDHYYRRRADGRAPRNDRWSRMVSGAQRIDQLRRSLLGALPGKRRSERRGMDLRLSWLRHQTLANRDQSGSRDDRFHRPHDSPFERQRRHFARGSRLLVDRCLAGAALEWRRATSRSVSRSIPASIRSMYSGLFRPSRLLEWTATWSRKIAT